MRLAAELQSVLQSIEVLPRRMQLETPGAAATAPLLRGVWGAALHDLDRAAYQTVFSPDAGQVPLYVLRPAPPDPEFAPAVDWILIGRARQHEPALLRAWDVASGMGLGTERRRFFIRQVKGLTPDAALSDRAEPWPLSDAGWPAPLDAPCRLHFPAPLRLMRRDQLIRQPTLTDLIVAACRRIQSLLPPDTDNTWAALTEQAIALSRETSSSAWIGSRLDLHRYSGRQKRELQINGVSGYLELPAGPGALWPLLATAQWLHLGKSTVVGLGQLRIESTNA